MDAHRRQLQQQGFAWIRGPISTSDQAFGLARALIDARCEVGRSPALAVIGDFVLPPLSGRESRDFQTLHFDFGLPLDPRVKQDVARYTALYIPTGAEKVSAVTRLVPLSALLSQRAWPSGSELLERLIGYGKTHGAWDNALGYVEGSLARVVEAAAGMPALPSVRTEAGFLCGMEFDCLRSELDFFEHHSLRVEEVHLEVPLAPGELLVFDNLALAHGRRGIRRPGELRQRVFGQRSLDLGRQLELRDRVLAAFGS